MIHYSRCALVRVRGADGGGSPPTSTSREQTRPGDARGPVEVVRQPAMALTECRTCCAPAPGRDPQLGGAPHVHGELTGPVARRPSPSVLPSYLSCGVERGDAFATWPDPRSNMPAVAFTDPSRSVGRRASGPVVSGAS